MILDGIMHSGACGNAACFDGHRSALHPPLQRAAVSGATIHWQSLCTTDHAHGGCEPYVSTCSCPPGAPSPKFPEMRRKKTAAPLESPAGRQVFYSIAVKRVSWHSLRGTGHAPGAPPPRYIRRPAHPVPHRGHRSRSPRGSSRRCPPRGPRRAPHPGNT